jgi:N-methylhydantoinase A
VAGRRRLFDPGDAAWHDAPVVERAVMTDGRHVDGPAVVTEAETTIVVPAGRRATRRPDGCIDVTAKGQDQ